jgi:hypothetical protein
LNGEHHEGEEGYIKNLLRLFCIRGVLNNGGLACSLLRLEICFIKYSASV